MWNKIKQNMRALKARFARRGQHLAAARVVSRQDHTLSRNQISHNALKVLYRLKNAGYEAYLVGGGVRDLLLGKEPKDFDIATDARPEQVRRAFRNCRLIGRRFRLAHIHFHNDIIEVATLRASVPSREKQHVHSDTGMLICDNVYGDIQQDVWRRDFTINALYYNISDFTVRDYVDGLHDLKKGHIRLIGTPAVRYTEDPVRILRAVRFSVKLGFTIHPDTEAPIHTHAHLLKQVAAGRMYEEFKKMFLSGFAAQSFAKLKHYGLLDYVLPQTAEALRDAQFPDLYAFIQLALNNTDQRIQEERPVTVGFLLATLLWHPVLAHAHGYSEQGLAQAPAFEKALRKIVSQLSKTLSIPKFVSSTISDIYHLQLRMVHIKHPKAFKIIEHNRFKAAYDFLLLRAETGEEVKELARWWTEFFESDTHQRKLMVRSHRSVRGPRARKRGRGAKAALSSNTDAKTGSASGDADASVVASPPPEHLR